MDCRKIQKLLMTDYIDGEINEKVRLGILGHLAVCGECRRVEEDLKKVIAPFKAAGKESPPDFLWRRIKDRIAEERRTSPERIAVLVTRKVADIFRRPKFAFAASAIAITIIAVIVVAGLPIIGAGRLDTYIKEQAEFMTGLDSNDIAGNGLGTSIEEYLL